MAKAVIDLFETEAVKLILPDGRPITIAHQEAGGVARIGLSVPPGVRVAPDPVERMPLESGAGLLTLKRSIGERLHCETSAGRLVVWLLAAKNRRSAKVTIHAPRDVRIWRAEIAPREEAA